MLWSVSWWRAVARLASILAGVGLVTTRLGLVAHELIGHGGASLACGGTVVDARLFWFGGGWIRYDLPAPSVGSQLAVSLGGIALELVIGTVLWIALARRTSLGAQIARATGGAIVLHASWYLATGTFHGFGDGWYVRHQLTDGGRYAVAIAAGLVTIGIAFATARAILGVLAATLPSRRIAGIVVATVLAGGLQAALAVGELRVRGDAPYGAIMQPERERVIAQELAQWERDQAARGRPIDPQALREHRRVLAAHHRELPFAYILGALTLLAVGAGAMRARTGAPAAISRRLVLITTAVAVGSVALVIAIDAAFA